MKVIRFFKVDVREPYMGNTLIIGVQVTVRENGEPVEAILTQAGSGNYRMEPISPREYVELFND